MIIAAKVARTCGRRFPQARMGTGRGRPGKSAKIEIVAARETMQ
jgi:hypothetical protein